MLQQSTVQFLRNLKKNNKKEWFDANRTKYESAKKRCRGYFQLK